MDLKFIAFLSFIFVSLILSVWLEIKMQKNTKNILATMSIAFNINLLVLGSASVWWLFYAGDGFSLFSGVHFLIVAFCCIFLVNILVMLVLRYRTA
ncbi:hypothetical protein [Bacillus sp. EAC]|uniref:hypothetical protein n=1 Tax=Bacillus sp. EAC TaxID=1978338 RepID=UPI000B432E00|nr:hypothetical protein [Bacillus sp. EAC]